MCVESKVAPWGEVVVGARESEAYGGGGVALGEPALEFGADAELKFGEARDVGGFPLLEFGGEMDGGRTVGGVGSEFLDGGDNALGVKMPLDEEAVGGDAAVERAGGDSIEIGNELAGEGAETIEIEMSVASFERVEGPFDEANVAGEGFVALKEFEHAADAAIAMGGEDAGHVGMEIAGGAADACHGETEADHGIAIEGANDVAAGLVGDDESDVRFDLEVGFAPDGFLDLDATVEVVEESAFADGDGGGHGAFAAVCSERLDCSQRDSIWGRGISERVVPCWRARRSISRKRRENLALAFFMAISGSTLRKRARLTATKRMSPTSDSMRAGDSFRLRASRSSLDSS